LTAGPSTLFAVGGRVFGTGQYLREILPDDRAVVALELPFNSVTPSGKTPGAFLGTGVAGLRLLQFDSAGWHDRGLVTGVRGSLRYAVEDRAGDVWAVGYHGSGAWRVDFRAGAHVAAPAEYFDAARGLPFLRGRDGILPLELGDRMVVSRSGALLRYERAAGRFVREDRLGDAPAFRIAAAPGPDGDHWWYADSPAPQIVHLVPAAENRWRVETMAAGPLQGLVPTALHYDPPTRTVWIGSRNGPSVTVDPAWRPAQTPAPLRAGVRRLATAAGELLWADAGGAAGRAESPAPGSALALDAARTSLRFEFAAPAFGADYRGVVRTVFRTRLDGLEDDWTPWSATAWREFSRLPFGDFVFRVQARDIDGRESKVGELAFVIAPPWWRTGWFVVLGGAVGIGAIAGTGRWLATRALRRRVQLLEAQSAVERERLRLARDLHDEVGSGLGRVILFAEEAERVKTDPEKLQASLGRVRTSAQDLVQHAREIVWAVSPQNDTLASVLDRFGHYTVETLGAAGIACAVVRPEADAIPPVMLGAEVRHSLFLALKEAVHNCVKYSAAKTAELRLTVAGGEFAMVLRDHGRGFAAGEVRGSGYGTASIMARAKVLGGSAEITSEVGQGTTVMLRVPLAGPRGAVGNS
jgi:signal transduction histidine kinase